jgi:hypothetical protein
MSAVPLRRKERLGRGILELLRDARRTLAAGAETRLALLDGLEIGVVDPSGFDAFAAHETFVESGVSFVGVRVGVELVATSGLAGILLCDESFVEAAGEFGERGLLRGVGCEVGDVVGVGREMVEFLVGPVTKAELPKRVFRFFSMCFKDKRFCWARVGIEVTGFGVPCGPPGGLDVFEVAVRLGDDSANGEAGVAGASDVVSFATDENVVACGVNLPGVWTFEEGAECFSGEGSHS